MARRTHQNMVSSVPEQFTEMRADYRAAKDSRFRKRLTGVAQTGSHADFHYRLSVDYFRMMELGRQIDRDDIVVGQGVDRLVDNVVPAGGIPLNPKTGDEALNKTLSELWTDYAGDAGQCHKGAEFDLHALARLAFRHMIVDGDIFSIQDRDGSQELIEGHRVRTPVRTRRNVVHGVLMNKHRRHKEIWVTTEDIEPWKSVLRVNQTRPIKIRDSEGFRIVQHVYQPRRLSQTRGVTFVARCLDACHMHDDIQFAKMVQQQIVSCFAFLREPPIDGAGGAIGFQGAREEQTLSDGQVRTVEGLGPGLEITTRPGEKITGFSPAVPNPEFRMHANLILQLIAINLGLPVQVLLLDASETNFSGWRGAMDQARVGFTALQKIVISRFLSPIYINQVRRWAATNPAIARAVAAGTGFRHEFVPPGFAYIEPVKDVTAKLLEVRNGLTSPRRFHRTRGTDWEDISTEIVEDNGMAIRKAQKAAEAINEEFPDSPVHWRDLLALPLAEGMKLSIKATTEEKDDDDADESDSAAGKQLSVAK